MKVLGDKSICFIRTMTVAVRPRFTENENEDEDEHEIPVCDATKVSRVIQKVRTG